MSTSDLTLVSRATRLGDADAFGELVVRYQSRILLLQRRLCGGDRAMAEDLTQETFLRAWQKLDSFTGHGSFGGWLSKLAYNLFLQHYRRHRRRRQEVNVDDLELAGPDRNDTALAELERILSILDPEDQIILTLNYGGGLTNAEVAGVLAMPEGTVKARIHRAKAKISDHIASGGSNPGKESVKTASNEQTTPRNQRARRITGFMGALKGA